MLPALILILHIIYVINIMIPIVDGTLVFNLFVKLKREESSGKLFHVLIEWVVECSGNDFIVSKLVTM